MFGIWEKKHWSCSYFLYSKENKKYLNFLKLKRSGDPEDPTPEVGDGTTPEGSLTLVSNLLLVVTNIGLDILGKFTKLNITKY